MTHKFRNGSRVAPHANLNEERVIAMTTEINFVGGSSGWWINTDASLHVCYDCDLFKTYEAAKDKRSFTFTFIFSSSISILIRAIFMKGLHRIRGVSSSSMSITTNTTRNNILSNLLTRLFIF